MVEARETVRKGCSWPADCIPMKERSKHHKVPMEVSCGVSVITGNPCVEMGVKRYLEVQL